MTRLERIGGAVAEAAWLAALAFVPVYFQTSGAHAFEGAKAGLVRALALVALAGGVARWLGGGRCARPRLVLPAGMLLLVSAVSTAASLLPTLSFWGDPDYSVGLATQLAWAALGAVVACNLGTAAQRERLVKALLLPSLPVVLYALLQRAGIDPVTVAVRDTEVERVTATLGQPVYLGAWLGMIVPFTLARAWAAWPSRRVAAAWGALAALQLVALAFTESRGPMLGTAAGLGLGFLALAARRGWRRPALALVALGVLGVVGLKVLPLLRGGAGPARVTDRLGATLQARGDSARFRSVSWEIAGRVFLHREPVQGADGRADPRDAVRRFLGFGLDVPGVISQPFYVPAVNEITTAFLLTTRYHNDLWDALVATGVLGLLATLAFWGALLHLAALRLGLLEGRRRLWFWAALGGGAAAGAAGLSVVLGGSFCFLGVQGGALGGLGLFLLVSVWRPSAPGPTAAEPVLAAAALAALAGHLLETGFSFTTVVTGLLVWVFAGLLGADPAIAEPAGKREETSWLVEAALAGGVLACLLFGLMGHGAGAAGIVGQALGRAGGAGAWLGVATLVGAALLATRSRAKVVAGAVGVALIAALAVALALAGATPNLERAIDLRLAAVSGVYLAVAALVGGLVAGLAGRGPAAPVATWRMAVGVGAVAGALLAGGWVGLGSARFDVLASASAQARSEGSFGVAEKIARRALAQRPDSAAARQMLARAQAGLAGSVLDASREARFRQAEESFKAVFAVQPYDTESAANLALLYGAWARRAPEERQAELAAKVRQAWDVALRFNPMEAELQCRFGGARLAVLSDPAGARESAAEADRLKSGLGCGAALRADVRAFEALGDAAGRAEAFAEAAALYQRALVKEQNPAWRLAEARAWFEAGRREEALAAIAAGKASGQPRPFERLAARWEKPGASSEPFPFAVAGFVRSPATPAPGP